jgi:hypothetical protein
MVFDPRGKNFKQRLDAFIADAKDTHGVTVGITSNARSAKQQQTMHVAHMLLYNAYNNIQPSHVDTNAQGRKVIGWSHISRADLDWDGDVEWDDYLRDAQGKSCHKADGGKAWLASHEPDKAESQKQARKILLDFGVGKDGKAMVAPGLERCGEPCKCSAGRSRHVEGLAADLSHLDDLEDALSEHRAGALDGYLRSFGLQRPLKDLPRDTRELWHVEAMKD